MVYYTTTKYIGNIIIDKEENKEILMKSTNFKKI